MSKHVKFYGESEDGKVTPIRAKRKPSAAPRDEEIAEAIDTAPQPVNPLWRKAVQMLITRDLVEQDAMVELGLTEDEWFDLKVNAEFQLLLRRALQFVTILVIRRAIRVTSSQLQKGNADAALIKAVLMAGRDSQLTAAVKSKKADGNSDAPDPERAARLRLSDKAVDSILDDQ